MIEVAKQNRRGLIYASSSSVYGIKSELEVTEDLALDPLTDYSKYKALGEEALLAAAADNFMVTIVRPPRCVGYSPGSGLI